MTLMLIGIALFMGFHLLQAALPTQFQRWEASLGKGPMKGIIALGNLAGMACIVFGWRGAGIEWLYAPNPALHHPALLLLAIAIWLLIVAKRGSAVRRIIRHPQLTAVILWGTAHLLLNGESRAALLFGALLVWAALEILLINRRDGPYTPPSPPGGFHELLTLVFTVALIAVLVAAHPWFAGMPVRLGG